VILKIEVMMLKKLDFYFLKIYYNRKRVFEILIIFHNITDIQCIFD